MIVRRRLLSNSSCCIVCLEDTFGQFTPFHKLLSSVALLCSQLFLWTVHPLLHKLQFTPLLLQLTLSCSTSPLSSWWLGLSALTEKRPIVLGNKQLGNMGRGLCCGIGQCVMSVNASVCQCIISMYMPVCTCQLSVYGSVFWIMYAG